MKDSQADTLIAEMQGEHFEFTEFRLTFGEVLTAKQKARQSSVKQDYSKRHELLWIVQQIFEKNGYDKEISWMVDIPADEMNNLMELVAEHNDLPQK